MHGKYTIPIPGKTNYSIWIGEINYTNVFKYIHSKGYNGILGMEHGNSNQGIKGELDVIKAYQNVDKFL